jgi:hypothetical protein
MKLVLLCSSVLFLACREAVAIGTCRKSNVARCGVELSHTAAALRTSVSKVLYMVLFIVLLVQSVYSLLRANPRMTQIRRRRRGPCRPVIINGT